MSTTLSLAVVPSLFFSIGCALAAQDRLSTKAEYAKYIDPILRVPDFGIEYTEDGAADATALFPPDHKPRGPVLALVHIGSKSVPLLIDCLTDGRVTAMRFGGSTVSKPMSVPLGYVCLDILTGVAKAAEIQIADCADDGLGACVNEGFYFRPDDYSRCWQDQCLPRPWVDVVRRNWRRLWMQRKIRFEDPYPPPKQ